MNAIFERSAMLGTVFQTIIHMRVEPRTVKISIPKCRMGQLQFAEFIDTLKTMPNVSVEVYGGNMRKLPMIGWVHPFKMVVVFESHIHEVKRRYESKLFVPQPMVDSLQKGYEPYFVLRRVDDEKLYMESF